LILYGNTSEVNFRNPDCKVGVIVLWQAFDSRRYQNILICESAAIAFNKYFKSGYTVTPTYLYG